jgi:hypothetical protein
MGQEPTTADPGQEPAGAPQDPPDNGQEPKTFDAEYVKSLRAEAAANRKAAKDANARIEALENEKLSETEKLKKEAEEGRKLGETATSKLRTVNLRDALTGKGFNGSQAKAVAKLLSGVEYDDQDEPTNIDAALKAAEAEYGDIAKPAGSGGFDGGPRGNGDPSSNDMNVLIRRKAGRG